MNIVILDKSLTPNTVKLHKPLISCETARRITPRRVTDSGGNGSDVIHYLHTCNQLYTDDDRHCLQAVNNNKISTTVNQLIFSCIYMYEYKC